MREGLHWRGIGEHAAGMLFEKVGVVGSVAGDHPLTLAERTAVVLHSVGEAPRPRANRVRSLRQRRMAGINARPSSTMIVS